MQTLEEMKPNASRMWDYVLGGTYNFAVDREAVKLTRKVYPLYEKTLVDQRCFLQRAMTYMVKEKKLDKFIDFGSGLPTQGNVHEIVQAIKSKAKVIYSDKDTIVVVLGQEILGKAPHVRYIYCDVIEPHTLFDSPVVTELFGDQRQVGIGMVGVFLYVPDEPLAKFFTALYEWAAEGSYIAVTCAGKKADEIEDVEDASNKMSLQFHSRTAQETIDLIGPWKLTEPGVVEGFYWGLPEDAPGISEEIKGIGLSFVAYK
jgi:hypothetical protein